MAGDGEVVTGTAIDSRFNPRPRMAGDLGSQFLAVPMQLFQSTPAYGGRRDCQNMPIVTTDVSIHARVWRATKNAFG